MDTPNDTPRLDGPARTARRHHQFPAPSPASIQPAHAISNASAGDPTPPATDFPAVQPNPPLSATNSPRAYLLYCADIEPRRVEWLWQGRLAAGSLAVISGNPGSGKTWVALAIAAALSNGHSPGQTTPPPSLGYRIDPAGDVSSAFRWTGPSPLTPEDLQTDQPIGAGLPRRRLAAEWLRRQLSDGPNIQQAVERAAQSDGESLITIRRAKADLGVVSTKNTFNGAWYWELPQSHPPPVHPD